MGLEKESPSAAANRTAGGGRETGADVSDASTHHHSTNGAGAQEGKLTVARLADLAILNNGNGHEPPPSEPAPRFRLMPADELDTLSPLRWLVEGEIPEQSFVVFFGETGSGKSFVGLDYALRIAQHAAVVYVAAEGAHGYAARKLAWCRHHKTTAGQLYFITVAPNLLDNQQVDELVTAVATVKPVLVIVDTLARTMVGGDENLARDMSMFVASCDRIRLATSGTVLVIHHTGRNGQHERGSTVLRGASDQVISIKNDDGLLRLACEKSKDSAGFPQRGLRLVTVETGRQLEDGTPETSCVVLPSDLVIVAGSLSKNGRMILETLSLAVFQPAGARGKQLMDSTTLGSSSFYSAISQLKKDGLIRQDEKGDPFFITDEGRKRLAGNDSNDSK